MASRTLLLLFLVLTAPGCVTALVNKQFPPVNTEGAKLKAIETSRKTLDGLPKTDVYLNLSAADLQKFIEPAVKDAVKGLSNVKLTLADQELIAEASFDHLFENVDNRPDLDVRMIGSATLHATAAISGETLTWTLLAPDSSRIKLRRVIVNGKKPGSKLLAGLLTVVLKAYLANVAGAIGTQRIRLDSPLVHKLDPKELIKGSGVESVDGDAIEFGVQLSGGAVLLDGAGVHAIGALSEARLGASGAHRPAAASTAAASLPTAFGDYLTAFRTVLTRDFVDDPMAYWQGTSALIGKPFVSGMLNKALDSADPVNAPKATAHLKLDDFRQEFGGLEIRADEAPTLNCQSNAEKVDCNPNYTCELNKSCDPGWPCRSCEWYDGLCHAERLACEADKVRFRTQCEAEKAGHRATCEAKKVLDRSACEIKKAAELAACNANQSWLISWQGAHFANVYGNAEFGNVKGSLAINKVVFGADLASVSIMTTAQAHSDVNVTFDLRPVDAGYFACPLPFGGRVSLGLGVRPQTFNLAATLQGTSVGQGLKLQFGIPDTNITFTTSEPPVAALISQNPHFALACAPLAEVVSRLVLGNVILKGQLPEQFIQNTFDRQIPSRTIDVTIDPATMTVGTNKVTLLPLWLSRSFGFRK